MTSTPCLEVNLDLGPLYADHQLQQALRLNASRDDLATTPSAGRKHSRSSSNISGVSAGSDESGKFDDADELGCYNGNGNVNGNGNEGVVDSPHSAKRRRSNDWPEDSRQALAKAQAQAQGQVEEGKKYHEDTGSFGRRWRNRKNGSPRANATNASNSNSNSSSNSGKSPKTPVPRGRRSRFVEGTMNDSVSEKPPSIYLRDDLYVQEHQQQHQHQQQQYPQHERGFGAASNHSHKSSGIFRFGKAIASAFNPFGGWGGVKGGPSGSGSGPGSASTDGNYTYTQQQEDDIARVQRAYEELKKTGFKGTVKGAYMQDARSSHTLPEQAWKSIQAKMDSSKQPATPGRHSRQISRESQDSGGGNSLRASLDLRRAKSSLGISSLVKSQEPDTPEVRKQKSRKDLLRQAKLLKKVSNLEDKLDRARRELRELQGSEEKVPKIPSEYEQQQQQPQGEGQGREEQPEAPQQPEQVQGQAVQLSASEQAATLGQPYYPKKFVPGALPTLPSERSLEDRAEAEDKKPANTTDTITPGAAGEPLQSISHNITRDANATTTPKKETKQQSSLAATTDSPSLKRKSPDPESLQASSKALESNQETNTNASNPDKKPPSAISTPTKSNSTRSRRSKLQKMGKSDSPGSVERRKSNPSTPGSGTGMGRRKPRYLNPTSPRSSPSARRSRSRSRSRSVSASPRKVDNKQAQAQARLKTKKGYHDLASASTTALPLTNRDIDIDMDMDMADMDMAVDSDADTDRMEMDMDCDYSSDCAQHQHHNSFYLQSEQHLNPDDQTTTTPRPRSRHSRYDFEYIPPVPPLPKGLAATAAKVDRRLARELERKGGKTQAQAVGAATVQQGQMKSQVEVQVPVKHDFEWPEDIF